MFGGKSPFGRPKTKWEYLVKNDEELLGGSTNWIERELIRDG